MKKLIHNIDGRLVCDHCDYVGPLERFNSSMVDRSCPTCASPLLTPRTARKIRRVNRIIDVVNFFFGWLGTEAPTEEAETVRLHFSDSRTRVER